METLIKRISGRNGELYGTIKGDRVPIVNCEFEVELYKSETKIKAIGMVNYKARVRYSAEVNCYDTSEYDYEQLRQVSHIIMKGDIKRKDTIYETVYFEHIQNLQIDKLENTWHFDITDTETLRKLLAM